jgi:hypothetical protein
MWIDKDDVFAEDKVREFKVSNPDAETHIRSQFAAEPSHSPTPTQSQLLTQHALRCMSSNAGSDFAHKYPAGAIADSPIPFSHEHPIHSPVPIVDFATMQPLDASANSFVPRPVTAQSSASDVVAMFWQLRVHTPAPLTPDGQRASQQASEMFAISFTPAERRGDQTSAGLESGAVAGPEASLGAPSTTPHLSRARSYDSAADNDL